MEMNEDGFLEELLALRREAWEANPSSTENHHNDQINGLFSSTTWASISSFDGLDSSLAANTSNTSFDSFSSTLEHHHAPPTTTLDHCSSFTPDFYAGHFEPGFSGPSPGLPDPEYMIENNNNNNNNNNNSIMMACKAEHSISSAGELEMELEVPSSSSPSAATGSFNIGMSCTEKRGVSKSKVKKVEGQPSKNLMAERRRRKRLNDRLSMLRSVVPKISKMDRTSILGDTIDYMKELLEKINNLQEETDLGSKSLNLINIFKDAKPNDALVRNSPKFDVERSNLDTRVEICCAGKPSLLLSTVTTLEAMGLEIQQCVISCFNDFSLQASCSEEIEQKSVISSEDIKQALFRNAGYGGRCL